MKQEDAKKLILNEWENWSNSPDEHDYNEFSMFYRWLEKNKPNLLAWRINPSGDRWQYVQGWLNVRTGYGR